MATITLEKNLEGFRYFWAKAVTGFTPSVHCARCLKGSYVKAVNNRMSAGSTEVGNPGEIIYICGVSTPYKWANNFHLVLLCSEDAEPFSVELYNGIAISVSGANRINFDASAAKRLFPEKGSNFLTCRNFQFGAQYFLT